MPTPQRLTNGITTVPSTNPLGMFGMPDPTKWYVFFDDFHQYTADALKWVVTTTEAGGGSATEVCSDANGGVLVITNDNADNDLDFLQSTYETFLLAAGKRAFFKTRFKINEVIECDAQIGLVIRDTTPLDATDGIYFQTDDGDANLDIVCRKNATTGSTTAVAHALVADTYLTAAWYWDGISEVKYYINDVHIGTLTGVYAAGASVYLPDTELAVSFGIMQGEVTNVKIMSVDYIFAAVER